MIHSITEQQQFAARILADDPEMSVVDRLLALHKANSGDENGIGYRIGSQILSRLAGLRSSASLGSYKCGELAAVIAERSLSKSIEAAKAGTHIEDPYEPDAEDGGDPYDQAFPTARRAWLGEAREIAGRRVDASMFQAEGL